VGAEDINEYRKHWEFGEAGCVTLKPMHGGHANVRIVVAQGEVSLGFTKPIPIHNQRELARFLACRLMEAVAIAEMQEIGAL
jgi:hypothetical protein